ncbi:hypothetical protein PLICRDRAFT_172113 [Plicaturopsis crispa FD-325 SS-3]|nr:hypothetical protein PLICRDRAFT_172113 [Plicaturopsis crispa FD-325 SS-3]
MSIHNNNRYRSDEQWLALIRGLYDGLRDGTADRRVAFNMQLADREERLEALIGMMNAYRDVQDSDDILRNQTTTPSGISFSQGDRSSQPPLSARIDSTRRNSENVPLGILRNVFPGRESTHFGGRSTPINERPAVENRGEHRSGTGWVTFDTTTRQESRARPESTSRGNSSPWDSTAPVEIIPPRYEPSSQPATRQESWRDPPPHLPSHPPTPSLPTSESSTRESSHRGEPGSPGGSGDGNPGGPGDPLGPGGAGGYGGPAAIAVG